MVLSKARKFGKDEYFTPHLPHLPFGKSHKIYSSKMSSTSFNDLTYKPAQYKSHLHSIVPTPVFKTQDRDVLVEGKIETRIIAFKMS